MKRSGDVSSQAKKRTHIACRLVPNVCLEDQQSGSNGAYKYLEKWQMHKPMEIKIERNQVCFFWCVCNFKYRMHACEPKNTVLHTCDSSGRFYVLTLSLGNAGCHVIIVAKLSLDLKKSNRAEVMMQQLILYICACNTTIKKSLQSLLVEDY